MNNITFAYPWVFLLALLLPLLAYLRSRQGPGASLQYSSLSLLGHLGSSNYQRWGGFMFALRFLALLALLIALARPQEVHSHTEIEESGIDLMLAIDLSPSMRALDYKKDGMEISRVDAVRETVAKFIEDRPNDRIGMVVFAGQAYLMSPLTLDHEWLLQNVNRLQVGVAGDATAIGTAIASCANRLRDQKSKSKVIVLLTDGANNTGKISPLAAAEAAHAFGIKIYTIGAGSNSMAKYPTGRNILGQMEYTYIPVDMDEDALRKIAAIGDGQFFRAADTDSLRNVYAQINQMEKTKIMSKKREDYTEYFAYPAVSGLLLLFLETALVNTRWRRLP